MALCVTDDWVIKMNYRKAVVWIPQDQTQKWRTNSTTEDKKNLLWGSFFSFDPENLASLRAGQLVFPHGSSGTSAELNIGCIIWPLHNPASFNSNWPSSKTQGELAGAHMQSHLRTYGMCREFFLVGQAKVYRNFMWISTTLSLVMRWKKRSHSFQ